MPFNFLSLVCNICIFSRAFFVVDKQFIGWPPVAFSSSGLWAGEGQIIIVGRDGKIGAIKRGTDFEFWETLSAPVVAVDTLTCEGVAVVTMNGEFLALSRKASPHFYSFYIIVFDFSCAYTYIKAFKLLWYRYFEYNKKPLVIAMAECLLKKITLLKYVVQSNKIIILFSNKFLYCRVYYIS